MNPILLAIESSTERLSVALLRGEEILRLHEDPGSRRHAAALLPAIDRMLVDAGIDLDGIDAIGVSIGPGSFTSLRIGLATVKGLAFGRPLPTVGVSTLEAMALKEDDTKVLPTIDVPVLVTSGSDDIFIPKDCPGNLHRGIKDSLFHEIAATGHVSSLEAPTEYNRVMEEFLQSAGFM